MLPTDVEHHGTQWRDKNSPSTEGEPQGERRETLLRWQASRLPIVNGWTTRHTALERYTLFCNPFKLKYRMSVALCQPYMAQLASYSWQ